jgi:hypothetical protein
MPGQVLNAPATHRRPVALPNAPCSLASPQQHTNAHADRHAATDSTPSSACARHATNTPAARCPPCKATAPCKRTLLARDGTHATCRPAAQAWESRPARCGLQEQHTRHSRTKVCCPRLPTLTHGRAPAPPARTPPARSRHAIPRLRACAMTPLDARTLRLNHQHTENPTQRTAACVWCCQYGRCLHQEVWLSRRTAAGPVSSSTRMPWLLMCPLGCVDKHCSSITIGAMKERERHQNIITG